MKRLTVLALLAAVGVLGITAESRAHGLFRRSSGCGGCAAPCAAPCPAPAPAPQPVKYEERKVTVYKPVLVDRVVEVIQCNRVMKEQQYKYIVCTPVMTPQKRKEIVCTPVYKDVDYTYTVLVPKCVQKEIPCTTYKCETVMVKETVPVCRTVCVTCVDACGRCYTQRQRVTVMEERTRCVVKRTPVTVMRMVNVTVCEAQKMTCKKRVCEIQRSERDVIVNVCTIKREEKVGTRMVCYTEMVKVKQTVKVCEMKPFVETIRVAICPPATTSCASPACGNSGGGHRGLFRRSRGCCN